MNKLLKLFNLTVLSTLTVIYLTTNVSATEIDDISSKLEEIGVYEEAIPNLVEKIQNGETPNSLDDKYDHVEPEYELEFEDGSKIERYRYPDGSVKILEIQPDAYEINGLRATRATWNAWVDSLGSQSGSGYSNLRLKVNGTYGIVTMTYYANVTYAYGGHVELTSVYEPGILVSGPGASYTITQNPTIVKSKPTSSGYAEAVMKANIKGDYYSGTYALRLFVRPSGNGYYASFGLN